MKKFFLSYISVLLTFAILDGIWLGVIAMPWYQEEFAGLLRAPFITWPWMVFYLLYCAATLFLAVRPNTGKPLIATTVSGFVLGATAYGTYNLTGYSIIAGWPLNMTLIDWLWGSIGTALIATAGGFTLSRIR